MTTIWNATLDAIDGHEVESKRCDGARPAPQCVLVSAVTSTIPTLFALYMTLLHGSTYLETIDVGRLSMCSKETMAVTEDSGAWKRIFEDAAAAGARCTWSVLKKSQPWRTRIGEQGLLDCFSEPIPQVLARTGYRRAAGCLLSKTCLLCGKLAALANPLLMMRTCHECAASNQYLWIMSQAKAKEAFLLSKNDCNTLPRASIPRSLKPEEGQAPKSTVILLMSDVVALSYAKYGGSDGLASEFAKRKLKASLRFEATKTADKRQKKRPKIEKLSDRPADDLASLRFHSLEMGGLPIPTVISASFGGVTMTHSAKCAVCNAHGTVEDIVMHERMDHCMAYAMFCQFSEFSQIETQPCPPFQGVFLSIPAQIEPTQELVHLCASSVIYHRCGSKTFDHEACVQKNLSTMFTFFGRSCRVLVEGCQFRGVCRTTHYDILFQIGQSTQPFKLMHFEWGETCDPFDEANETRFEQLKKSLGLVETSSIQLLAALLVRSLPFKDMHHMVCALDPKEEWSPMVHGTLALLKACIQQTVVW